MAVSKRVRERVYNRDRERCVTCGAREHLTLDHRIPKSKGGTNAESNLQVMCHPCNQKKGDTYLAPPPTKKEKKQALRRRLGLRHTPACNEQYCFWQCPVFLDRHPEFRATA